jgi:hypothetical protein
VTFINRLPAIVPSQGTPLQNDSLFLKQAFALTGTTQQVNAISWSGSAPTISKGKIRLKFIAPTTSGVNPSITSAYMVLDDGTNYVQVGNVSSAVFTAQVTTGAASIPNQVDRVVEFEVDINATELSIATTLAGTSPVVLMDVEISGTT